MTTKFMPVKVTIQFISGGQRDFEFDVPSTGRDFAEHQANNGHSVWIHTDRNAPNGGQVNRVNRTRGPFM